MRYFTTGQAAVELGTDRRVIWELIDRGVLPAVEVTRHGSKRRQWRIAGDVIEAQKNRPEGMPIGSAAA